jgi:DNA-binding response OmpR family regulator
MNNQNLIIFNFTILYQILKELDKNLNFEIIEVTNEKSLKAETKIYKNHIIITKKLLSNFDNQFIFNQLPIRISKFVEILNVEFLKQQFSNQSKINIKSYILDLNSREMILKNIKLNLTEKEVNTIIYLSKKNKPVSVNELQINVWRYQLDMETHTVETHIYRLRKKILKFFDDENFIMSNKNGYQIK